jgi:hypothetical protein
MTGVEGHHYFIENRASDCTSDRSCEPKYLLYLIHQWSQNETYFHMSATSQYCMTRRNSNKYVLMF